MELAARLTERSELHRLWQSREHLERRRLERLIASGNAHLGQFEVPGYCIPCEQPVRFAVDLQWGGRVDDGIPLPNWRERLVCPRCQLNNRMRVVAGAVAEFLRRDRPPGTRPPRVYLMEQVTAIFQWLVASFPDVEFIVSEYLGPDVLGGTVRDGIRHEDCEALSLADGSVDAVVSNEVLEHVSDPAQAIREVARVLSPGGEFFLTIPLDSSLERNRRRAEIRDGRLAHLEEPAYHGNPISEEGSLVFTDFGWEVVDQLRDAGFEDVAMVSRWSYVYGHFRTDIFYFHATR